MEWKKVIAWGMYDFANTSFSAIFVTFFFPFYIKEFLGGNEFHIGLVFGVSMLLVGVIVPVIGAYSDQLNRRMPFIVWFTILCCMATAAVGYVTFVPALLLGGIANFFYFAALSTYNAILPTIANKGEIGKVSGIGTGMGYLGTLLSLGIVALLLYHFGWESLEGVRMTFPATAIIFMAFSLVTFFGLKEKAKKATASLRKSLVEVKATLKDLRRHKDLFTFLVAMFLYTDAINAVIIFLYIFARSQIGLDVKGFMLVYVIFSLSAMVGSFAFGKVVDKIGPKKTLTIAGVMWLFVIGVLMAVSNYTTFLIAGILGGIALGTVWTAQRPYIVAVSPYMQLAQFFGYQELTDKFSGVLGPIVYGFLAAYYGYTAALASLMLFFIGGLVILHTVRDAR